jgi:hypothetical protein
MALVLYYPTGIVHFRNLEILKKTMPDTRFRVVVEPWVKLTAREVLADFVPEDIADVENNSLPDRAWENVEVLFLCMASPNRFRLYLVNEAVKRGIPVTAVEEVNQLALNDGIINHYFLPIDYFGVPSAVEKERFIDIGLEADSIKVTGWPFFNKDAGPVQGPGFDMRAEYNIAPGKKCCLLVLGSLKEFDIVSLETREVRKQILETVYNGLPEDYQLLIKPHPIEFNQLLQAIREQVPGAVILNPKHPIEPLLAQSDMIVNRGNSQVTLLAMLQKKPLIVVPAGLNTIFHGILDEIICDSPERFREIALHYDAGNMPVYDELLALHFPLNQEEAQERVKGLIAEAIDAGVPSGSTKHLYIAILFAFLGDTTVAADTLERFNAEPAVPLLTKLFQGQIGAEEFEELSNLFPGSIQRWHLQALFIRSLTKQKDKQLPAEAVALLEGFEGQVNPHSFIEELMQRVELEYRAGRTETAEQLADKLYRDYSIYKYFRETFALMRYVYRNGAKYHSLRKFLWLASHPFSNYTRKYIKDKL